MGRIAWVLTASIVVFAGIAMVTGRGFTIGISQVGSLDVEGGLAAGVSTEEAEQAQDELREVVAESTADIEVAPRAEVAAAIDIGGIWGSVHGSTYEIVQFGSAATIVETDGFGFITATGEGVIDGNTFRFDYLTAASIEGTGQLTLDASGTELSGSFDDVLGTRPALLVR